MGSEYKGLFTIWLHGKVTDVQVVVPGGHSIPLPIEQYIEREVQPPWQTLPTKDEYQGESGDANGQ